MIRRTLRRPPARRGAILLVVLGMLALFAVVGLSFVLYAESEATGARNNRAARNELADPEPAVVANQFLAQLLFETTDTTSAVYGHSFARSRFGPVGGQSPFTGGGIPGEALSPNSPSGVLAIDRLQVVNFRALAGWDPVSPDQTLTATPINKAVPYTYPDRNNFYLAYYDPVTDQVTVPSFHRNDLFGSLDPTNIKWRNNGHASGGDSTGYYQTLRPRQAEHPAFPTVTMNADGTYTGDVSNLKFLTGNQKNDSLWMDMNLPIKEWRGKRYKPMVAPLVLDLGGKIDLRVAGNNRAGGASGSHHGWGQWEINPNGVLGGGAADTAGLVNLRLTGANPAGTLTAMDRFRGLSTGTLNGGRMTPQYSLLDADGWGTGAADPMTLPAAGGFSPFPSYTTRFAGTQALLTAELAATHGQSISPSQWGRRQTPTTGTPYMPSLEDQLRLQLRSGGPKGATGYAGQFNPNARTSTLFSVSQRWGEISVPVDNTGTNFARLAAIDLTRPLADYRANLNGPVSPQNIGNLVAARVARQNLARDIFARLAAVMNLIDGTNVAYNPVTSYLSFGAMVPPATLANLQVWAQYAANMVDQIDSDDVSTTFVWNPIDPTQYDVNDTVTNGNMNVNLPNFAPAQIGTRTVFGTELPKLVLNEAFNAMDNDRQDKPPPVVGVNRPAQRHVRKLYWIELHNPLPTDAAQPEGGAARLQYDPAITFVYDATASALAPYVGPKYAPYQIEVAEVPAGMPAGTPQQPYSAALVNPLTAVATTVANHVTTPVPGMTHKIILNDYTAWNAEPAAAMALPANDATNVVLPANGGNAGQGYALIGPRDLFPSNPQVATGLNVADPPAMPMGPVNSLIYDAGLPSAANLSTQGGNNSVVLLRRLVNPYLPAQPDPTANGYNPYMTVDFLEYVPVRDRVEFDDMNNRAGYPFPTTNGPSIGRRHAYAAAPVYGTAVNPAVADQVDAAVMMNPPHTFLRANSNLDNAAGLAWLAHLDREPVNVLELLPTSAQPPSQLTQLFYDGQIYQKHLRSPLTPAIPMGTAASPVLIDATNFPTAYGALDQLSVGSRLPGVPLGGREPGRVNINTAGDLAILQAVLDPQTGNRFDATFVATAWTQYLASRTPGAGNVPAATTAEGGTDRPFQPRLGLQESLFRQGATVGVPALFNAAAGNHQYLQSEPLRKGWNNLATVSDGFLVVFTVGFFEVDNANRLGKELSDKVPGDLRAQYAGIVDRTGLTVDPAPNPALPLGQFALGAKPWETKLAGDIQPTATSFTIQATCPALSTTCTVYDDGAAVTIQAGTFLHLGYADIGAGGDGEWVRVAAVAPGTTVGTAVITIDTTPPAALPALQYSTALQRFHGGGGRVSNAQVGHPGPQPLFDYREPTGRYRGVLPFFMRMGP